MITLFHLPPSFALAGLCAMSCDIGPRYTKHLCGLRDIPPESGYACLCSFSISQYIYIYIYIYVVLCVYYNLCEAYINNLDFVSSFSDEWLSEDKIMESEEYRLTHTYLHDFLNGYHSTWCRYVSNINPDSKVHGANMGPIWGRQGPGWPMSPPWTLLSGNCSKI